MQPDSPFHVSDEAALLDFMRRNPFSTVICLGAESGEVNAVHIPLLALENPLRLQGHVARINPVLSDLQDGVELLCIFHGPSAYESPDEQPHAPLLPTWNYANVHVRGKVQLLNEQAAMQHLQDLVQHCERAREAPWQWSKGEPLISELFPHIVAFEVRELRLQSRVKLTRAKRPASKAEALHMLEEREDPVSLSIRRLLELSKS